MPEDQVTNRQQVLHEIWTTQYPDLAELTPDQLVARLQRLAPRDGTLESRHQAYEFTEVLTCWLITQGITDQLLFELMAQLPADYSDEYKPWSPEYANPITNGQEVLTRRLIDRKSTS